MANRWLKVAAVAAGTVLAAQQGVRWSRRMELGGRVVLITGSSRGLGLAMAREFGAKGARIALHARDAATLERAAEDLRRRGVDVRVFPADLTQPGQAAMLVQDVIEHMGQIDVLVNNAAQIAVGPFETMTDGDFREMMDLTVWAPLQTIRSVLSHMRLRGGGRIVNISSIGGRVPVPHLVPYCTAKFALVGLSGGLRGELMKDDILVTTVCPGLMRTGSPRNARFKGQHEKEYTWFTLSDSTPGLSMAAATAARRIVSATVHGDAQVTLGLPAKLGALLYSLAPNLQLDIAGLVTQTLMPAPGGIGTDGRRGWESESALTQSPLTAATRWAEQDLNQRR